MRTDSPRYPEQGAVSCIVRPLLNNRNWPVVVSNITFDPQVRSSYNLSPQSDPYWNVEADTSRRE